MCHDGFTLPKALPNAVVTKDVMCWGSHSRFLRGRLLLPTGVRTRQGAACVRACASVCECERVGVNERGCARAWV